MKHLLMIANPFPPMISAGNARLLRFLRHLPEHGWETTVLTVRATGPVPVPDGVRVERTVAPGPEGLYALARHLRPSAEATTGEGARGGRQAATGSANVTDDRTRAGGRAPASAARSRRSGAVNDWLMIPDQYAGWIAPAVLRGRSLLAAEQYDAIFSSSPRPSVHLIAAALAGKSGLPWLADYRDPWTTYQFRRYPTVWHRRTHEALETWALRRARHVTAVNAPIVDELVARHPQLAGRATVLPNGFDPDEPADAVALGEGFWFVHTGRLYGREPQTRAFLTALAHTADDVRALFLGLESPFVAETAAALGIGERVRVEPYVPHARALGAQRAAGALLLVNGRQPESMSSKVFEYLASERPIFAVSPPGSAARGLFAVVGGARCVLPDDEMTAALTDFVDAARAGTLQAADQSLVSRYDAGALTAQLAGLLEEITS
jgi:glycosyltransferase involved in cell wall biosynthesis